MIDLDFDLDAMIETAVNVAQIANGVNPHLVKARSKTAVLVAAMQNVSNPSGPKANVWTDEEDAFLRDNLGVLSQEEIAERLGRSLNAIKVRWTRRGYHAPSQQPGDIVAHQVGQKLGMCVKKVRRLIDMGIMPGRTIPGDRGIMVVDQFQLLRWCVQPANWIYLKAHRIKDKRIKQLVEMRQARWDDEWWRTGQVAQHFGLSSVTVINRRIRDGHLPATRWDNWYVLKSDALQQKFAVGKGSTTELDWSVAGDAFLVLAAAVGIPADYIDQLRKEPRERCWNRLRFLIKRRKVQQLVVAFNLPVQQRGQTLFADWREVADRFPGLVRSVEMFRDGRALSHVDRQYLRGVMQSWAEWYGLDELAHRLKWSQNARSAALMAFYQQMVTNGVDPFGGYHG